MSLRVNDISPYTIGKNLTHGVFGSVSIHLPVRWIESRCRWMVWRTGESVAGTFCVRSSDERPGGRIQGRIQEHMTWVC